MYNRNALTFTALLLSTTKLYSILLINNENVFLLRCALLCGLIMAKTGILQFALVAVTTDAKSFI